MNCILSLPSHIGLHLGLGPMQHSSHLGQSANEGHYGHFISVSARQGTTMERAYREVSFLLQCIPFAHTTSAHFLRKFGTDTSISPRCWEASYARQAESSHSHCSRSVLDASAWSQHVHMHCTMQECGWWPMASWGTTISESQFFCNLNQSQ